MNTLNNSRIDVNKWLKGFNSVGESVKESVDLIKNHLFMLKNIRVHGLIIDPHSGKIEVLTVDFFKIKIFKNLVALKILK